MPDLPNLARPDGYWRPVIRGPQGLTPPAAMLKIVGNLHSSRNMHHYLDGRGHDQRGSCHPRAERRNRMAKHRLRVTLAGSLTVVALALAACGTDSGGGGGTS